VHADGALHRQVLLEDFEIVARGLQRFARAKFGEQEVVAGRGDHRFADDVG
jgi:hypothetical protein